MEIEGFVLVGGASSRMGRDKSGLEYEGTTFGANAAGVLLGVASRVTAVGGPVFGYPDIPDGFEAHEREGRAALYGLHAALKHCEAEWAAVLACDLPCIPTELFRRLAAAAAAEPMPDAVVPRQHDGRLQPLAAIYRREPSLRAVEQCIRAGEMRLQGLLTRIETRSLEPEELAGLDDRVFTNVNTSDDYVRFLQAASCGGSLPTVRR